MDPQAGAPPVNTPAAQGILAERRAEWDRALARFDDAVTRIERLIELTDRALPPHDPPTAEKLHDLLKKPEKIVETRHDDADLAYAAVLDARLALLRADQ